jgi:hypothetical protein
LSKEELHAHWQRIRGDLQRIYEVANVPSADDAKHLFFEYMSANELGLAYELICDQLHETGLPISTELYRIIQSVGSSMEYSEKQYERLRRLVRA